MIRLLFSLQKYEKKEKSQMFFLFSFAFSLHLCTFALVMRLSEKIACAVLVLLAIVLAVLCVRSIWFAQEAADTQQPQMMTNGR